MANQEDLEGRVGNEETTKIPVLECKFGKYYHEKILRKLGNEFLLQFKEAYEKDSSLVLEIPNIKRALIDLTEYLIQDIYFYKTRDEINEGILELNEAYKSIDDAARFSEVAEKMLGNGSDTKTIKKGQTFEDAKREWEEQQRSGIQEKIDPSKFVDKEEMSQYSERLETVKMDILEKRAKLNNEIRIFIKTHLVIFRLLYGITFGNNTDKDYLDTLQMRLGNANEDMKYISRSNPHIKLEESKYDSQTHRTANLNHLGKGLAPETTQFLEYTDGQMDILRNAK